VNDYCESLHLGYMHATEMAWDWTHWFVCVWFQNTGTTHIHYKKPPVDCCAMCILFSHKNLQCEHNAKNDTCNPTM